MSSRSAYSAFEATFSLFGSARFHLTEGSAAAVFLVIGLVLVAIQGGGFGALAAKVGVPRLYAVGLGVVAVVVVDPVLLFFVQVGHGVFQGVRVVRSGCRGGGAAQASGFFIGMSGFRFFIA